MTARKPIARILLLVCFLLPGASCTPRPAAAPALVEKEEEPCPVCTESAAEAGGVPGTILAADWVPAAGRAAVRNLAIACVDQDGQPSTLRDLIDRPALLTFFYTRCQNSAKCSAALARLATLQARLERAGLADRVRLLAVTYEPQFDTPERIHRFGTDRGLRFGPHVRGIRLDPERHERLTDELEVPVNYNAGWVNTHGVELFLLDAGGRVARTYRTILWDDEQVLEDLKKVLGGE